MDGQEGERRGRSSDCGREGVWVSLVGFEVDDQGLFFICREGVAAVGVPGACEGGRRVPCGEG